MPSNVNTTELDWRILSQDFEPIFTQGPYQSRVLLLVASGKNYLLYCTKSIKSLVTPRGNNPRRRQYRRGNGLLHHWRTQTAMRCWLAGSMLQYIVVALGLYLPKPHAQRVSWSMYFPSARTVLGWV